MTFKYPFAPKSSWHPPTRCPDPQALTRWFDGRFAGGCGIARQPACRTRLTCGPFQHIKLASQHMPEVLLPASLYCSAVAPLSRITFLQRTRSCAIKSDIAAGVLPTVSKFISSSRLAISGCFSISATALENWLAIAGGVPGGAATPSQIKDKNPGSTSDITGISGRTLLRL